MENMYEQVARRLRMLGVDYASEKDEAVIYATDKAESEILNETNQVSVPEGLRHAWIDMAAGFYLQEQKSTAQLQNCEIFGSAPMKSITEGDVSVTFASASDGVKTPEARLDELINKLINPPKSAFAKYRRFVW